MEVLDYLLQSFYLFGKALTKKEAYIFVTTSNYFTFLSEIEPLLCMAITEKNLCNFGLHLKVVKSQFSRHYSF